MNEINRKIINVNLNQKASNNNNPSKFQAEYFFTWKVEKYGKCGKMWEMWKNMENMGWLKININILFILKLTNLKRKIVIQQLVLNNFKF